MRNVHKNIKTYKPRKEHKVLTGFDDMIADMINKKILKRGTEQSLDIDEKTCIQILSSYKWLFTLYKS